MANKLIQMKDGNDNVFPTNTLTTTKYNVADLDNIDETIFFSAYDRQEIGGGWSIGINIIFSTQGGLLNSGYKAQIVLNILTNNLYIRSKHNENWSSWKKVT